MNTRKSPSEWSRLLSRYRKSGERQKEFCKQHGITLPALQYHLRHEKKESKAAEILPGFVEVSPNSSTPRLEVEIIFPSGAALRLRG